MRHVHSRSAGDRSGGHIRGSSGPTLLAVMLTGLALATLGGCQRSAAKVSSPTQPLREKAISFDDLEFEIEKDADFKREMLTPAIEAMDGTRVKISGFILPASAFKQTGLDRFVLIRDNQECCFGPGAYIYHNIQVEMEEGKGADFSDLPVQVEGEMRIKPWFGPDDKCYSVYHMTANRVSR